MYIDKIKIVLKDRRECVFRTPEGRDGEIFLNHLKKVLSDTDFMVTYPEELNITLEDEEKLLEKMKNSDRELMISAFCEGQVVGNIAIRPVHERQKLQHRCTMGIGVIKEFWGYGIGNILIEQGILYASKLGYEQIELGVYKNNEKAIKLYEKYGFNIYGELPWAFKLKYGSYESELLMYKNL